MAQAIRIGTGRIAHRIAARAAVRLRAVIDASDALTRHLGTLLTAFVHLPAMRHSRFWRESLRLWQNLVLRMSDGYNFEQYLSTQYGLGIQADDDAHADLLLLPDERLLALAHNVAGAERGAAAMRVLIQRAVRIAESRGFVRHSAEFRPAVLDGDLHVGWRDASGEASGSGRVIPLRGRVAPARRDQADMPPARQQPAPVVVDDDVAFELNVPELTAYRASTRH
jgi:hypothetical protein